jgi:hypothetical protein
MSSAQSLKVYDILKKHFKDDADSKTVIEGVEMIIDKKMDQSKEILATKKDLSEFRTELKGDIHNLREEFLNVRAELIEKIYKSKTETIIWIVAVGIIQFILTILSKKFL